MQNKIDDLKGFPLWLAIACALITIVGLFNGKKEFLIKKGTLESKPVFISAPKNNRFEFRIKEEKNQVFTLRYIYSDLSVEQKKIIRDSIKAGDTVSLTMKGIRYRKSHEIYGLKVNGNHVYEIKQYEALCQRELIGSTILCIVSMICFFILKWYNFRMKEPLIYVFLMLCLFLLIWYL